MQWLLIVPGNGIYIIPYQAEGSSEAREICLKKLGRRRLPWGSYIVAI